MTDTMLVNVLTHLGVAGTVALVLGWLLIRSEKRVDQLLDMNVAISRESVKTTEQTIAAINTNTASINTNTAATRQQADETRTLGAKLDSLLQERGRRGK